MRISVLIGVLRAIETEHGNVQVEMLHGLALEYGRQVIHREPICRVSYSPEREMALVQTASVKKGSVE